MTAADQEVSKMDTSGEVIPTTGHVIPVDSTAVTNSEVSIYRNPTGNSQ
jgi:hypothetical protein